MRKLFVTLLIATSVLGLAACGSSKANDDMEIKIGATSGPYSDQVKESIKPLLEKEGYKVKLIEYNDYIQPNNALDEGSIDANVFQTDTYLNKYTEDHGLDLINTIAVPTAPIGLYTEKHKELMDLKDGMKVTLPNDPVNMARALAMMEQFEWITLQGEVDPTRISEKDIDENKFNLNIVPLEAGQLPRSLGDTDFAFINGNFAIASGLTLEKALALEKTPENYMIKVTFREEDIDKPFAEAIRKAYQTEAFQKYTNEKTNGFVKPDYLE